MKQPEEKRLQECPVAYQHFVDRTKKMERKFLRYQQLEKQGRKHFDDLVSWVILAACAYGNIGMLQNVLKVKSERDENGITAERDEEPLKELISQFSIGAKSQWLSYERNPLFWAIFVGNNPLITQLLYDAGATLLGIVSSWWLFKKSIGSDNLFSKSKSNLIQSDLKDEKDPEKWIEHRMKIIRIVIWKEKNRKRLFNNVFISDVRQIHDDFSCFKNQLEVTIDASCMDLADLTIEKVNASSLNTALIAAFKNYWGTAVKTFFFTCKNFQNVQILLPNEVSQIIASYLIPGDIKLKKPFKLTHFGNDISLKYGGSHAEPERLKKIKFLTDGSLTLKRRKLNDNRDSLEMSVEPGTLFDLSDEQQQQNNLSFL